MRGPLDGIDPLVAPLFFSFQQAREDLARWTDGLSTGQLWTTPHEFGSVGFHVRHIGGSVDRLVTYLTGEQLSSEQMSALKAEHEPGATREMLLEKLDADFRKAEQIVRGLKIADLTQARGVGRKQLPTTVIGLIVHMAEHTQRHVGQAISAAKWARTL